MMVTQSFARATLAFGAVLLASTTLSGAALAQAVQTADPAEPSGFQDIVVTARRASETAQSVPLSITAFSQDTLRQNNITSAADLNKAVPGLTVAANSGNPGLPAFAIRGRGLNYGAAAGAVETYFADVPLSMPQSAFALPPQFFDIGSFQVLKGPQGTLFGRSTTGGAVVIVPHDVDDRFDGYARIQGGNYRDRQAEAAVNIPLVKDLAGLRLAGFYWKRDGYQRIFPGNIDRLHGTSLDGERANNQDVYELRGTLKLTPLDAVENTTIVTYHSDANRGTAGAGIQRVGPLTGSYTYVPSHGSGTLWSDSDVRFDDQGRNTALAVVNTTTIQATDGLTIKNIMGYINTNGMPSQATNTDGTALQTISQPGTPRLVRTRQYTEEFQLQGKMFDDKLKWITGVLFDLTRQPSSLDHLDVQSITYVGVPASVTCVSPSCVYLRTSYGSNKIDSFGAFGSASYEIVPNLTASAGFRRSLDSVRLIGGDYFSAVQVGPTAQPVLGPLTQATAKILSHSFAGSTYNADLTYKLDRDKIVYVGFRHGYKRGGFQASGLTQFDPETVNSVYLGLKAGWTVAGHRLRTNVEFYHDSYKGQQLSYTNLTTLGTLVAITDNVDKSRYEGVDVELNADVTKWWTVSANYAYIKAKIQKWIDRSYPGSTLDLTRNPIPYVPKNKLSATSRMYMETGYGQAVLQGVASYEGRYFTGPTCVVYPLGAQLASGGVDFNAIANGGCNVPSRTIYDLRLEFNNVGGTKLSFAANVLNLTNKIYRTGTTNTTRAGVEGYSYAAPRTWSLEATYKF